MTALKSLVATAGTLALAAALTTTAARSGDHHEAAKRMDHDLIGAWTDGEGTLNLLPGGHFAAVYGDRLVIGLGTYAVKDGTLTVRDRDGLAPCGAAKATYAYERTDDTVRFTLVGTDACEGRRDAVLGSAWTKVEPPEGMTN